MCNSQWNIGIMNMSLSHKLELALSFLLFFIIYRRNRLFHSVKIIDFNIFHLCVKFNIFYPRFTLFHLSKTVSGENMSKMINELLDQMTIKLYFYFTQTNENALLWHYNFFPSKYNLTMNCSWKTNWKLEDTLVSAKSYLNMFYFYPFFFIKSYKVKILNENKGYFSTFNFQIHAKS